MPTPCFTLSPLMGLPACCGKNMWLLLLSAILEAFQNIRGVILWIRGVCKESGLEKRHMGGSEMGTALKGSIWSYPASVPVDVIAHYWGAGFLQHRCGDMLQWTHKHGRTSKEHMPQQQPFPAASCLACSEPYVHPAPRLFWKGDLFGMGWAQRWNLLSWHTTQLCLAARAFAPIRTVVVDATLQASGEGIMYVFVCVC